MKRVRDRRILALLLLVAVVFTLAFSAIFLAQQGNHVCAGEGCPVCLQIGNMRDLLSKFGCICLALFAVLALQGGFEPFESDCARLRGVVTLVSLNVKLSD